MENSALFRLLSSGQPQPQAAPLTTLLAPQQFNDQPSPQEQADIFKRMMLLRSKSALGVIDPGMDWGGKDQMIMRPDGQMRSAGEDI